MLFLLAATLVAAALVAAPAQAAHPPARARSPGPSRDRGPLALRPLRLPAARLLSFDVDDPRFAAGSRCLSRRAPVGLRGVGRIRLGRTRARLLRVPARLARRTRHSYRWCVRGLSRRVVAVFSSRSRRARSRLVATTAPAHRLRRVGRGVSTRRLLRRLPRARRLGRGLYRAGPGSRRIIGVRAGRVRFVAVATRGLLRDRRALRRHLRRAGL